MWPVVHGMLVTTFAVLPVSTTENPWFVDPSRLKSAPVRYAKYDSIRVFPVPVVSWRRAGLAGSEPELDRIKARIIYPIIVESRKAVAAMLVEFNLPDGQSLGLTVLWADGETREALITKNEKGEYDPQAYKVVFAKPVP